MAGVQELGLSPGQSVQLPTKLRLLSGWPCGGNSPPGAHRVKRRWVQGVRSNLSKEHVSYAPTMFISSSIQQTFNEVKRLFMTYAPGVGLDSRGRAEKKANFYLLWRISSSGKRKNANS